MATTTRNLTTYGVLLLAGLAVVAPAGAAPGCAADCGRRMAECRTASCGDLDHKACRDRCRAITGCRAGGARIRTLASIVSRCRVAGGMVTAEQRLDVRRGDCPPETVMRFAAPGAVPDVGLCRLFGEFRNGSLGSIAGPLQRLGVSPDGRAVLFEISTHDVALPGAFPPFDVPDEGIFAVESDGSGMRRLGEPSRERPHKGPVASLLPPYFNFQALPYFNFSPDGRFVVYSDRGPGSDGTDAGQLVVMDVRTGARTQVTAFTRAMQPPPEGADVTGFFIDDETISGSTMRFAADGEPRFENSFLVNRDGSDFGFFVPPSPIPGSRVVEHFDVTGRDGNVTTVIMPGIAAEPRPAGSAHEVWTRKGPQLLQLTNFGRTDTSGGELSRDGDLVFYEASTNRLGTNPMNNCQIFSIPRLGGPLRQLTQFDPPLPSLDGCNRAAPPPNCYLGSLQVDPVTGSIVFSWTCDPFGVSPIGHQLFAMRPDGSGLRQVTNYDGLRDEPDGSFSVELPFLIYSARGRSAGHHGGAAR